MLGNIFTRNIPKEIGTRSSGSKPLAIARYIKKNAMIIIM